MMKEMYVDRQLADDLWFLMEESPDPVIDWTALSWVLLQRHYSGPYKGWTDCPMKWLAKKLHLGYPRLKRGFDRLEKYGIIEKGRGEGFRRILRYRYQTEREEGVARPSLRGDELGAYGLVWRFNRQTWKMEEMKVAPSEYVSFPTCRACGRVYHPTEGRGPEGLCAGCYVKQRMREALEKDEWPLHIEGPYGTRDWSKSVVMEYLCDGS